MARLKEEHHGDSGAIKISFSNWYCEAQEMWIKMLKELGHADAEDGAASGDNQGIWNCPGTVDPATHKRSYAASAFYTPNAGRPNYKVLTGAQVSHIEMEESGGEQKAVAIHYIKDGTEQVVRVGKEVVVSAGSFKSPQILELSGIGNADVLKAAGVEVKVENSGVGKNLQEHLLLLGPCFQLDEKKVVSWDSMRNPEFAEKAMEMFHAKDPQDGDRGIVGATISGFAFQSMESFLTKEEIDEVHQLIKQGDTTGWSQGMKETNQLQLEKWLVKKAPAMEQIFMPGFFSPDGAPKEGAAYYTNTIALQYPFSRGTAHISSSDPLAPPIIDPKYFSNAGDLRLMALYLKHIIENAEKNLKNMVLNVHAPSPEKYKTVEDYEEYLRTYAGTTYHPVGTCSMMSKEKGGVVDSNLKVYGTSNIRVADASILPVMPSGHILSACYVIGLKGEFYSVL
jgi:choline dehydrogenase-like flavoprotein